MPSYKYINKLQGHRVLIVGGSSGVGFGVAEAALEYGATVVLSSSSQTKLDNAALRLRTFGETAGLPAPDISTAPCDLSNPSTLEDNVKNLLESATLSGKLDHVVFTAGDALDMTPLTELSVAAIEKSGTVRRMGSLMLAKHLPKYMNPSIRSSFTVTGGTIAWRPAPGLSVVAAGAGFVEASARGFAIDLRPIRVNCITLGPVRTEAFNAWPKEVVDHILENMRLETLTGTIAKPEDVAEAYIFAMKSTFITGETIVVDGGRRVGDSKST